MLFSITYLLKILCEDESDYYMTVPKIREIKMKSVARDFLLFRGQCRIQTILLSELVEYVQNTYWLPYIALSQLIFNTG